MAIKMNDKIDVYLANPAFFQLDLFAQRDLWMSNVVRPLGSAYERSKSNCDQIIAIAKNAEAEQNARLAKIGMVMDIVVAVCLVGVDMAAAAALKNVSMLERLDSRKSLDSFLAGPGSFQTAFKAFNDQKSSFRDILFADIDSKIKGLVSTGTVTSVYGNVQKLLADVAQAQPKADGSAGVLEFQNGMQNNYESMARAINEFFVSVVRDTKLDQKGKRAVLTLLCNAPFMMPPSLSLDNFLEQLSQYFEVCRYCQMITDSQQKDKLGTYGLLNNYLADAINSRVLALTGYMLTNVGVERMAQKGVVRTWTAGGMALGDVSMGDIRMAWDGYSDGSHMNALKSVILAAKKAHVDPFFIAQGISCQMDYGRTSK